MDEQALRNAVIVQARVACAMIRLEGMKAANLEREQHGFALAYDESAFEKLIEDECIHHNAVVQEFYS